MLLDWDLCQSGKKKASLQQRGCYSGRISRRIGAMNTYAIILFALIIGSCEAFSTRPSITTHLINRKNYIQMMKSPINSEHDTPIILNKLKRLPAVICTALLLGLSPFNQPADAAQRSGGRVSGSSSFRSSSRPSSSLRSSNSGYSGGYRSSTIMPVMPMYGGFGYGYGLSPFGFMPVNPSVLLIGALAYVAFQVLSNRITGADFSGYDDGESGSLGSGATVLKLQVGLDADWGERGSIMEVLSNLAAKNNGMSNRSQIAQLLSDASLALLRKQSDWHSAAYEGQVFSNNVKSAEPLFQSIAIKERAKFDEERTSGEIVTLKPNNASTKTQAVVSLVVAMRGKSNGYQRAVSSLADVRACLQGLASDSLTDNGENVMAVELLWTPVDRGDTVTSRDLIIDYPELIKL